MEVRHPCSYMQVLTHDEGSPLPSVGPEPRKQGPELDDATKDLTLSPATSLGVTPASGSLLLPGSDSTLPSLASKQVQTPWVRLTHPRSGHLQVEGGAGQRETVEEGLGRHTCKVNTALKRPLLGSVGRKRGCRAQLSPFQPGVCPHPRPTSPSWGSSPSPQAPLPAGRALYPGWPLKASPEGKPKCKVPPTTH